MSRPQNLPLDHCSLNVSGPESRQEPGVVVVGGGLAGLAAAAGLARGGCRVTLCEGARHLGGRASTTEAQGFRFNLGPHALYAGGPGMRCLQELGVRPSGRQPSNSTMFLWAQQKLHRFPGKPVDLLRSGFFGLQDKLEAMRVMAGLRHVRPQAWQSCTLSQWLESEVRRPRIRQYLAAIARLTTYCHAPEALSAGVFLRQLQLAMAGVLYLDQGWQTLVDGLAERASEAGARLLTGVRVESVQHDGTVRGVILADGSRIDAAAVVLATSPARADALVDAGRHPSLQRWHRQAMPVRAACLDLGLARLPAPKTVFALGLEEPWYFSVHSATADLAPDGAALVHAARYLASDEQPKREDLEQRFESWLDHLQPGWRELVVERRFMPRMVVSHRLAQAGAEQPTPRVPGIDGLYVAGDWVGDTGLLADAVLASAAEATRGILASESPRVARVA